jgi:hypothetical protein
MKLIDSNSTLKTPSHPITPLRVFVRNFTTHFTPLISTEPVFYFASDKSNISFLNALQIVGKAD